MNDYIDFLELGSNDVLILLPSNWLTSKSYQSITKKLAEKYRVIVPNLYRGNSRYKRNAYTANDYVIKLHAFLSNLNINRFYLIGFSFGGMIAVNYAIKYPSTIKKMLLVSSIKFPLPLKKNKLTPVAGLFSYIKLLFHNTFSIEGIKVNILWLYEGIFFITKHTKQFFLDIRIATEHSQDSTFVMPFPVKVLLASNDEFITYMEIRNTNKIEVEVVDGRHAWFFLKENLLVKKVFEYFTN